MVIFKKQDKALKDKHPYPEKLGYFLGNFFI